MISKKLGRIEDIPSLAESILKKYKEVAKIERNVEPFISIFLPVITQYEFEIQNLLFTNYKRGFSIKMLVCVHYPPSQPTYYWHEGLDFGEALWKAELEGWETFKRYEGSKRELPQYKLLHPKISVNKKIKVKDVCNDKRFQENDVGELMDIFKSLNQNILDIKDISTVRSKVKVTLIDELYCDTLDNMIYQEKSFWTAYVETSAPCEDLPERKISLSYSTGAFGGLRTFKFLENELMKKCTDMAKRTVKFSRAKASYKNFKLTSGSYKAILDGRVAGVSLHEYGAGHLAEAHRILKTGEALVFEGKLGKQVAPEEITLIDDSKFEICGIKPTSFYIFDVEGVEKVPTEIIRNGIFNSYLHSKLTAGTLPEDRGGGKLTGNARVETEAETNEEENKIPCPRMSTLYLKPGNYKFEELLEEAKGGLYISSGSPSGGVATELGIGYVNIDEIYFIDKDKELIPLRVPGTSISLTGNAISFMKKIKMIGDKSTISLDAGYCGAESGWVPQTIFAPALLVRDIELEITRLEQPLKKPLLEI